MNLLVLGIFIGAVLAVFCSLCLEAYTKNGQVADQVADAELEAWLDWREEWKRRKKP